ncbi:TonB-dependent receptor [Terrimonas sp. NA20]|uniref:TonB-dependent receptor n=1 Tax=Terrimonas ginsenosidimutans TaxID=2908004 RepID=A0ABS9KNU4_9BACT|nr:TonB-dependent receptor [Terrimonas ginsenosidimutans]MCG2614002.1 TonB-dependent receptor [Terrimonas ginsenosidimutans]
MLNKKILPALGSLLIISQAANTQEKGVTITAKYDSLPRKELLLQLEKKTGFFFYFDSGRLDTSKISFQANDEALEIVLNKLMDGTASTFAIDYPNKKVYITQQIKIQTTLPRGFYADGDNIAAGNTTADSSKMLYNHRVSKTEQKLRFEVGSGNNGGKPVALIQGIIRNGRTGEPMSNVSILIDNRYSTTSNQYGEYSVSLPTGDYPLSVVGIGIRELTAEITVHSDGKLNIDVQQQVPTLREVIVSARKTSNIRSTSMGTAKLDITSIKRIPALFGETDILRAITTLPGVKTVGEASTGFNVRGGSTDQNLILYNEGTIYNPSHFFGMFSAFNPEVVKDVELFKGTIPAKYGGRLASVLNVNNREGNKKNITGSAGIGAITSRLQVEGPLDKNKTSFIAGGRTTYANWLIGLLPAEYEKSRASFYDINLGISHRIDSSNNLYFSGYLSNDKFSLNNDTTYKYTNRNFSLKWKRTLTKRLQGELIAGYDHYEFETASLNNETNAYSLAFRIRQMFTKLNFTYFKNAQHSFDFGISSLLYKLDPGSYTPGKAGSLVVTDIVQTEQALENAAYFTHIYSPTPDLSFSTGLRYSLYSFLGPKQVNYYAPGEPKNENTLTSTVDYKSGKFIKTYGGPEIRFSTRYAFNPTLSVKAGFNSQRQYIHMLSNTTAISPTDIWKLSDPNVKPQRGEQVSVGLYKNLKSNTIETSVEFYYKRIHDYLDYKPGAKLVLNHSIETDVISTEGKAYGAELMIRKTVGKLTGWISYTYSRVLLRSTAQDQQWQINNGREYPANYDKPHDVTLTSSFRINHRLGLSMNSTYSTGRPITYPIGRFYYAGSARVLYSDRNQHRIPDYFRMDLSVNIEGNHKVKKLTHNSWTVGCYNLLGRKNPYSVYFVSEDGSVNGYKLSVFGNIIPFINYNIRF